MKEIQRTHCVLCENARLTSIQKLTQPIYECRDSVPKGDWTMEYGYRPERQFDWG